MTGEDAPAWTALIAANLPSETAKRVRANRRLRQTGALAVRPGVYALPDSPQARAALESVARELASLRASAMACRVSWLDPADEERLRTRFEGELRRGREQLLEHIGALERAVASGSGLNAAKRRTAGARLARMQKRLGRMTPGGTATSHRAPIELPERPSRASKDPAFHGRTWVTRKGVLVDRIASAWLIRRFIDPRAGFLFIDPKDAPPEGALRFDMAGAEFGHEGERCTFEVLVDRFGAGDPALRLLAEVVHDLDLKDGRYGREEAAGVARVIAGLATAVPDDGQRVRQGQWLFDCLYASQQPRPPRLPKGALP